MGVEKNQIVTAVVEGVGSNGEGIVRHEGVTFFVPYCLPGEKVRFRVLKVKDKIGYGRTEEILTPAEARVRPKCPVFSRCGGCQLQHLNYGTQLRFKGNLVRDALKKIAGIVRDVPPAVRSEKQYGYRNKLQMPIGTDGEGNGVIGFYAERSHRIVPVENCAIHPEWSGALLAALRRYMKECAVRGYDEKEKKGALRHVVVREIGGNYIVTLVSATRDLPNLGFFVELLSEIFESFSLYLNFNAADTNVVFGEEFRLVYGPPYFEGEEQGIVYEAGPVTFLQVNDGVRAALYEAAIAAAVPTGEEVIVDAYSGGGLLTAMLAKRCRRVYGIEVEKEAVRCADSLKEKNGLQNMVNICGRVEDRLPEILQKEKNEKLCLILDPPRAGIARSVTDALLKSGVPRLILVSCNPAALARDVGILTGALVDKDGVLVKNSAVSDLSVSDGPVVSGATDDGIGTGGGVDKIAAENTDGRVSAKTSVVEKKVAEIGREKTSARSGGYYAIESVLPFDMFPQTKHVETLVCLFKKTEKYISVDMEFGEEEGQVSLKKSG